MSEEKQNLKNLTNRANLSKTSLVKANLVIYDLQTLLGKLFLFTRLSILNILSIIKKKQHYLNFFFQYKDTW